MTDINESVKKTGETARKAAENASDTIADAAEQISDAATDAATTAGEAATDFVASARSTASDAAEQLRASTSSITSSAKDLADDGITFASEQYQKNPALVVAIGVAAAIGVGAIVVSLFRRN